MKQVTLTRYSDDGTQTLGTLSTDGFHCRTLELPWKDNQHSISCIPHGIYLCKLTRSNRLSALLGHDVSTYEVFNVVNRSGIRLHSVSFVKDLLGCIALGSAFADIDGNGQLDLINSRVTVNAFTELMDGEDFELLVCDNSNKTASVPNTVTNNSL